MKFVSYIFSRGVDGSFRKKGCQWTRCHLTYFGFSIDAVKHWECGRRTPEASARAFLTVIAKNPEAVMAALHTPEKRHKAGGSGRSAQRSRKSSKPSSSVSLQS